MCPIAQRPVLCAASYEQHTDRTTRKKSETKRSATAEIERRSTARLRCNGKPSIHTLPGTECSLHDLYPYRTLPDGCVALSHDGPKNTPQMKISARVDQRTHSTGSARLSSARLALTKERLEGEKHGSKNAPKRPLLSWHTELEVAIHIEQLLFGEAERRKRLPMHLAKEHQRHAKHTQQTNKTTPSCPRGPLPT